jgi:2'-5' RNA ligase
VTVARCFVALEIAQAAALVAAAAQSLLDADLVRKTPRESLHVTLKFLGDVSVETVAKPVFEALAGHVSLPLPSLGEAQLHAFPSTEHANVIVLSCSDPDGQVAELAARAEAAAFAHGVPREERAFHPHVTLARTRAALDVRKVVKRFERSPLGRSTALSLFESHGGRYARLASFAPQTDSK